MNKRFTEIRADADQKQAERFDTWISGKGIPFVDEQAKQSYQERVTLFRDAIRLQQPPRRIPVAPSAGFFPLAYAGVSMYQGMYDYGQLETAWVKYHDDFEPDAYNSPVNIVPGKVLDILDLKFYQWPGHGVDKNSEYQFVEDDYMKAEEYQDLIDDPTGFFLNVYFPRIFGALEPFTAFPLLPPVHELPVIPGCMMPFGTEAMQKALQALGRAGEAALAWRQATAEISGRIMGRGFPAFSGGFTKAPFDVISDSLRGTRGAMLDMFRCPDLLLEACERLIPIMVKNGVAGCRATGHLMPFIPLHKGADTFMSQKQFSTFYWPSLKKLIIGLINEGLVPLLFAEGSYNDRLETIADIPKGKVVWWFDRTDMAQAKKSVGQVACIAGNIPLSLLCTGTPEQVETYCQQLMETAGSGGGFIFSSGAGLQGSKPANVKAMMDFCKSHTL